MGFSSQSFPELPVFCFCSSPLWSCWFPSPSQAAWTRSWRRRGWPWSWWGGPRRGWRGLAKWPLHPAHIKDKTCNEFNLKLCKPFNTFNGKMMETCFRKFAIISHILFLRPRTWHVIPMYQGSLTSICDPRLLQELTLGLVFSPLSSPAPSSPSLRPSRPSTASLSPIRGWILTMQNENSSETHLSSDLTFMTIFCPEESMDPSLTQLQAFAWSVLCHYSLLQTPEFSNSH